MVQSSAFVIGATGIVRNTFVPSSETDNSFDFFNALTISFGSEVSFLILLHFKIYSISISETSNYDY